MANKYKEFRQLNLPAIEDEILKRWQQEQAFEKSIENREGAPSFVFYEGPPSANGMPGIHHVISRTLKDLVCRYKTMQGFKVERKGGWDTHGLPVELGVEKELGITKEDIGKTISVAEYNQKCREAVLRYKDKWDELTTKMGYWVDLQHPYITFTNDYIESLWWALKQLYNKGLLYKSVSIQPYSPAAGTGLSSHELNQPGTYRNVKDTSVVAMFHLTPALSTSGEGERSFAEELLSITRQHSPSPLVEKGLGDEVFFLAWTTTPWTLPSNLGLTVGPNIDYVLVKTFNPYTHLPINVILAKAAISRYFKPEGENGDFEAYAQKHGIVTSGTSESGATQPGTPPHSGGGREGASIPWKVLSEFKGHELAGLQYEQLMPYEANSLEAIESITPDAQPFKILLGDFVTTEDGTGIVHTAPAFGADDYKVGKKYNIGILTLVDREGKFVDGLGEFSGRYIKDYKGEPNYADVNVDIAVKLKKENRAFKVEKYEHSYPHCWRTDKPVVYYPLDAWFIRTTARREEMIALNKTINWKPESTGTGRFGNWLENMVDWNLSRSRFWGTPLPIWRTAALMPSFSRQYYPPEYESKKPLGEVCIGSIKELVSCTVSNKQTGVPSTYNGYFIDLGAIRNDLVDGHFIANAIENYNNRIPKEEGSLNFIFEVDPKPLIEKAKASNLTIKDLTDARLNFQHLSRFLRKIIEEDIQKIDLHKPYIDDIVMVHATTGTLYFREPDLVDVWFDSGAMPYAQWHYPFENQEKFKENFPADFICEGVDQTRGWFYTLHALATMLFDSVAYKTVVSNGLVLDKNGNKMSKRLGNVVDPFKTIDSFGADATRWYLMTNASPWDNLKFDIEGIKEVQRKFFGTLYNTYQFFALYANVDGFTFSEDYIPVEQRPEIDRWILSSLHTLIKKVTAALDDYEPTQAGRLIEDFVDEHLSNWYVRLCRRRFWKGEYEFDKIAAYQTLYECLDTVVQLMAPISPFFSDELFIDLNAVTGRHKEESVHLTHFPVANEALIDTLLEERMQLAQDASSLILSLRKKADIKVRQPLQRVLIPVLNPAMQQQLQMVEDLILNEVNVKEIEYLNDTEGFIKKKIKPNFGALGKKLGPKMKVVTQALANFSQHDITRFEKEGRYIVPIGENDSVELTLSEVEITSEDIPGWTVASKGPLTVALDINITPELAQEGDAREFVNRIQKIRKDSGFDVTDRIEVLVNANNGLKQSLAKYNKYICAEILADKLELTSNDNGGIEIEINDKPLKVIVLKKG